VKMRSMAASGAPNLVVDDDRARLPRSSTRRPGRAMLAAAALVLGIGSCQLPQPRPPKLPTGAVGGGRAVAAARASTDASGDPT
jgi:hypothetical protein